MIGELVPTLGLCLLAAWRTLPLFLLVFVLDRALKNRTPARLSCVLWTLVIARLFLPVSTTSSLAISWCQDYVFETLFVSVREPVVREPALETFSYTENGKTVTILVPGDLPAETRKDWGQLALARNGLAGVPTNQVAKVAGPSGQAEFGSLDFLGYSLASIWAAGVVVFGCRSLVSYCRFAWHLYRLPSIEDQDTVDRLLRACDRIKFGRRPEIKEVASLNAPAVFGIVRPVICLPSRWRTQLSDTQFDLVLRHELAHLRRRDGLVLLFADIARSLHWWHPMSWIAYSRLQASMERAADEAATRGLSESNVRDYGNLLLQYANNNGTRPNRSLIVGLLAISPSITLRERIEALVTRTSKQRRFAGACTTPVIGLLACVGLTDAKPIAPTARPTDPPSHSLSAPVDFYPKPTPYASEGPDAPIVAREVRVNVENALRKTRELQPGIDAERFVLFYFLAEPFVACPNEDKTIENGILTARLTPSEEATMRQRLEVFERSGPWQFTAQVRLLEAPVQFLQTIDWTASDDNTHVRRILDQSQGDKEALWRSAFAVTESNRDDASRSSDAAGISAAVPILTTKIGDSQYDALIDLCQGTFRVNVFQGPKVTLFNGQVAEICDVASHAFVTDLTVVPGDRGATFHPKIAVRDEGWRMYIQAVAVDTESVDVRCAFSQSHIREVWSANLPYRAVPNRPDKGAEIQVPLVQTDSIAVQSSLSPGQAMLFCSPKPYNRKAGRQPSVLVLTLRVLPISDMECVRHFIQHLNPEE